MADAAKIDRAAGQRQLTYLERLELATKGVAILYQMSENGPGEPIRDWSDLEPQDKADAVSLAAAGLAIADAIRGHGNPPARLPDPGA